MIFFYIDESGTGLRDSRSPFFVLGAVAIRAEDWPNLDHSVRQLKRHLVSWAKPEDFEIKARDIRRGEKFFAGQNWSQRAAAVEAIANLIASLPCGIFVVRTDKRRLPEYIEAEDDLYRLTFWRLLEELHKELERLDTNGMLLLDARSDLHSSVQDRRLLDTFHEWSVQREVRFLESPWFGFSAFYSGLQLADFCAYLTDFAANDTSRSPRNSVLFSAFEVIAPKVRLVQIP
ncbi:MAG: hypothetical protein Kow00120_04720 [Anaerolineae bacterium]